MFALTFLGTSASVPSAERNHPALLVEAGSKRILIDCGEGTGAHIGPHAAGTRFALGQNRHGRIVGMDALACEDVRLDRFDQRH